jgi:S1-C subfamily serine protease
MDANESNAHETDAHETDAYATDAYASFAYENGPLTLGQEPLFPVDPSEAAPHPHRAAKHTGRLVAGGVAAVLVLGGAAGVGIHALTGSDPGTASARSQAASGSAPSANGQNPFGNLGSLGDLGNSLGLGDLGNAFGNAFGGLGDGSTGNGGSGGFGNPATGGGTGSTGSTGTATGAQQVGVVDIDTVLGYQNARAAGTGMILSSNGEVLTNNHVVAGATSITVTVVATGKTYQASVVGVDPTDDVAVVQMKDASGLDTVHATSSTVNVGDDVVGVGNAGGVGGTPSAAAGQVTALNQSITATDEGGGSAEQLTGLIETNAAIAAGDSGGPLFNSNDEVIGMDTAASSGGASQGYAIPIAKAVSIAQQIESGQTGGNIQSGSSGFLGVGVDTQADGQGADVAQVVTGGPAANAGLAVGDVITSIDGTRVSSASGLTSAMASLKAGDQVHVTWTDANGQSHQSTATLASGPAR